MGKTEHRLWIGCVSLGLMTLCLALFILPMFPSDAAGDVSGYGGAVYAFEFAHSASDLIAVFGAESDPERDRRIAMMDSGNRWDFLFMSTYTLFGIFFGLAIRKTTPGLGSRLVAIALIAGFADMLETRALLSITADLRSGVMTPMALHDLWVPVRVKFAALLMSVCAAGFFLISTQSKIWKVLGSFAALAALLSLPALWQPDRYGAVLGLSIGAGWTLMLVFAAMRVKTGLTTPPLP